MKKNISNFLYVSFLFFNLLFAQKVNAQLIPGTLDTTFNSIDNGFTMSSYISTTVLQPDGKVLIGGDFVNYNGKGANRIARLNSDGSLDNTFSPSTGANALVQSIAVQPDGKILIGGNFTSFNGSTINRITRLNADGSLDNSFSVGTGANSTINSIVIQPDGKILIGGNFTSFNSTTKNRITRLNADGSIDNTFTSGTGADVMINSIAIQNDGKILIGGDFTSYNGTARNRIVRLNADGSLDNSFSVGTGANSTVNSIVIQPDGKILIGGYFSSYNSSAKNRITRINSDGSTDITFTIGTGANGFIRYIAIQTDGKIIIGGDFTAYNSVTKNRITLINTDGTVDNTFDVGTGTNNNVRSIAIQPDGKTLVCGDFTLYNGALEYGLIRQNTDGSRDVTFRLYETGGNSTIQATAIQSDGKILIGGSFTSYNGTVINRITRLNADGTLDGTFNVGTGANSTIYKIAIQIDGKIIIGGFFTMYNGTTINRIARLNADGSLDNTFTPGTGASSTVNTIAIQTDGKILIGGSFTSYNGITANRIARLNANGTLDNSFVIGSGANSNILSIVLQTDGKILVGGSFNLFNDNEMNRIIRLNTDGTVDNTFLIGTGANFTVWSIAQQNDGKILIGGGFTGYNGVFKYSIARLNIDGTLDNTFNIGSGANSTIISITLQSNGKIIIGGSFTSYNGTTTNRIARLNSNGSVDNTFIVGTGANNTIYSSAIQANGKILIAGDFTAYNNKGKKRIASIIGSECVPTNNTINVTECTSYTWHATTYTTSGVYTYSYNNGNNCPSVDTLHLTINSTHNTENIATCNSNYVWHTTTYTSSGIYTYDYTNINGCASTDTLHLTIDNGTYNTYNVTECNSYLWHGVPYSTGGVYTYSYNNVNGCSSVDTLNLTITTYSSTHNVETVTACNAYVWHSVTYNTSGIYTFNYSNINGCTSVDTLHLTINYTSNNTLATSVCSSYTWNGLTYTSSGKYIYNYTNANGCSSSDTLHLTINSTHNSKTHLAFNNYTWNGTNYTSSGTYTYNYTNANSCPSVDTLHLTIDNVAREFWGMNTYGGTYNAGTIFKTDNNGNNHTIVHSFYIVEGKYPDYIIKANNGKVYGTTLEGGINNIGTFYEYDPATNIHTLKFSFDSITTGIGSAKLAQSSINGKIYGITRSGGINNRGVLFEYDPATNIYTKKIDFGTVNAINGICITDAANGKMYGIAGGGVNNKALLFEYDPVTNSFTNKFNFVGGTQGDSFYSANILLATNGKIYGYTPGGGTNGKGVLFEIDLSTNTFTKKLDFNGTANGTTPSSLIQLQNGKLYGTTYQGGTNNVGVLFEYDITTNTYTKKIDFTLTTTGSRPQSSLMQATNGKIYGTTSAGGTNSDGVLFEYDPITEIYIKKKDFTTKQGESPSGSLVEIGNGKLYGKASGGSTELFGVLFEYDFINSTYTKKIDFNSSLSGLWPYGSLVQAQNGKLYGTTSSGGDYDDGVLFEFDPLTNTFTKKSNYTSGKHGGRSNLIQANNGKLYGTAGEGSGFYDYGSLISYNIGTNVFTYLHTFDDFGTFGAKEGSNPFGGLIQASNGKLYGLTSEGSYNGYGTIYEFDPLNNNCTFQIALSTTTGGNAYGSFIEASNGKLYGLAKNGGTFSVGAIFEYNPANNTCVKKISFNGVGNGANPTGSLIKGTNGKYYGMTSTGGTNNKGVIFEYDIDLNITTKKFDFSTTNGTNPYGSLMQAFNGKLYGMTKAGGANDFGVIFEYDPTTNTFTKKLDFNGVNGKDQQYKYLIETRICYPVYKDTTVLSCGNFVLNTSTYTTSGNYSQLIGTTSNGCDSILAIHLTIDNGIHSTQTIATCNNYIWHTITYTTSGVYTYSNTTGCPSIDTLHLTINYGTHNTETITACNNYVWHTTTYNTSGIYTYSYNNANGCVSVDTLHLTIDNGTNNSEVITACNNYLWHSTTYITSGVYTYSYNNSNGCPSTDTLHLTINYATHNTETITACNNYVWHTTTYNTSGIYTYSYNNANGCVSVDTLHLTIDNGTNNSEAITACNNYLWHSTTYITSGVYTYSYNNANGCASVDTLHLTINNSTHNSETITACDNHEWHATTYTTSGVYTYSYNNVNGCVSVDTLHLTINNSTHNALSITECSSYLWNGTTYTTSGVYTRNYTNAAGCQSVDTLHLTIDNGTHNSVTITSCNNYVWNAITYTTSGVYTYNYTNANGCASVDILNLTIKNSTASTINAVACSSYTLNAQTYIASNTYTQIIPNAAGCDSTITINLTIDACTPVWPGDANNDFVADNFDVLNIGLAYGATSYTRNAASNTWNAQPSKNWPQSIGGVNYKHADCDGNGSINDDDTLAISLNYGQTHSKSDFTKSTDSDPIFSLQFVTDTIENASDGVLKINLGDATTPANNVYGIAFSINYDSQYIKENSCYVSFNNTWLGDVNTNLITLQKDQYLNAVTHVAVTRKNHTNVSGNGEIGEFHFKTKDVISGANDLNINLSNVKLIDNTGFVINVQNQGDVIVVKDKLLSVESNTINKNSISIYPNPNNGLFTISATNSLIGADIKITTVTGQIISENHIENASIINIDLSKEANGFYFVEINQDGKSQRFKLIKN